MTKLGLALSPVVVAAVMFALSGVAAAQSSSSFGNDLSSGRNAPSSRDPRDSSGKISVAGAQCPRPNVAGHKINESQALDLAQQYADKNLKGFKVAQATRSAGREGRGPAYGGGYNTVCYNKDGDAYHSVEYSFDAKNSKGSMRTITVDQFGSVSQYHETESASR
ncbi:MAG TPA: hypothetical protein VL754_15185 [Verrucomicrobiae bacterium]|nr:hypothetical protein [Verrucomicrobiae bacterium]